MQPDHSFLIYDVSVLWIVLDATEKARSQRDGWVSPGLLYKVRIRLSALERNGIKSSSSYGLDNIVVAGKCGKKELPALLFQ